MNFADLGLERKPDVLLSELFGTLLLSESALTYVADARDNLAKQGVRVVPQKASQYAQLVMSEDLLSLTMAKEWDGINLQPFNGLVDSCSLLFSKVLGLRFSSLKHTYLSDPISIIDVDFEKDTQPQGRIQKYRIVPTKSGVVHAVMAFWEAESEGAEVMSTHPDKTRDNLPRDMHWGQGIQLIEDMAVEGSVPAPFEVTEGVPVILSVRYSGNLVTMQFQLEREGEERAHQFPVRKAKGGRGGHVVHE